VLNWAFFLLGIRFQIPAPLAAEKTPDHACDPRNERQPIAAKCVVRSPRLSPKL
jgi:hypothetical protein